MDIREFDGRDRFHMRLMPCGVTWKALENVSRHADFCRRFRWPPQTMGNCFAPPDLPEECRHFGFSQSSFALHENRRVKLAVTSKSEMPIGSCREERKDGQSKNAAVGRHDGDKTSASHWAPGLSWLSAWLSYTSWNRGRLRG